MHLCTCVGTAPAGGQEMQTSAGTESHPAGMYVYKCKSFHQMKGDVGIHNVKNHRNKGLYSMMIYSMIMCNP